MDDADFDIHDFLPYLLNQAGEACGLAFQKIYKQRYGMLRTEWRLLFHLGRYGEMTAKEFSQRAHMHKTKVSRAVAALEAKRFMTRDRIETDRRHESLRLTRAGEAVFQALGIEAKTYEEKLLRQIDEEETRVLKATLRKLAGLDLDR